MFASKYYNSKNCTPEDQPASNPCRGTSTTERDGPEIEYVAGVIDGDGNFDLRRPPDGGDGKRKLARIRITLANRDVRILERVKRILKCGKIRTRGKLSTYSVSTKAELERVVRSLNGRIRLKIVGFIESCEYFDVRYIEANYVIPPNSPYLSGLIDTDGSVIFSYSRNVIQLMIEFKQNEHTEKLNLDYAIPGFEPRVYKFNKTNQTRNKVFYSIRFAFDRADKMIYLYNFVMASRLYSDFKFYRLTQIKSFMEIRGFKNSQKGSAEHKVYSKWVYNFVSHLNPTYTKLTYLSELSIAEHISKGHDTV